MMMMMIIINNRIERRKSRFLQSPHCAANCLEHVTHKWPGRIRVQNALWSRATHVPRGTKGQLSC